MLLMVSSIACSWLSTLCEDSCFSDGEKSFAFIFRFKNIKSLAVELFNDSESFFIGDHAFVCTLHFIHKHDVHIGPRALVKACGHHHAIEQILVLRDLLKVFV